MVGAAGLALITAAGPASAQSSIASSVHATAAAPKAFWGAVMTTWYGPYDAQLKCWVVPHGAQRLCLRPAKLATFDAADGQEVMVAVSGTRVAADGRRIDGHPDGGGVGFLALAEHAGTTALVARGGPFDVGADGAPPPEDAITVMAFGIGGPHGWLVTSGGTNMGITVTVATLYARVGAAIKPVAVLPDHYDDDGACEDGRNVATGEPCTRYDVEMDVAAAHAAGTLPDITLRAHGAVKGKTLAGGRVIRFDAATGAYAVPKDVTIDGGDWTRPLDGR